MASSHSPWHNYSPVNGTSATVFPPGELRGGQGEGVDRAEGDEGPEVVRRGQRRVVHQFGLADTWDRREEHRETLGRGTPVDQGRRARGPNGIPGYPGTPV